MRHKFYLTIVLAALSTFALAQWTATSGPYGGNIQSLKRASSGTLYSVINQKLYQSSNSGDTWSATAISSPSSLYLNDLMIDTDGKMYAVYYSTLYVSSDNGANWTVVSSNLFQNAIHIDKVGPDGVFVIWGYGGLYVSINKGVSWTQISALSASTINGPSVVSNAAGDIFYATNSNQIWKHPYQALTANWSSANMTQTPYAITNDYIAGMTIDSGGRLYVVSYYDFFKSTDNGASFTSMKAVFLAMIPSISYFNGPLGTDGTNVYLFSNGQGQIYKTANQGTSWTSSVSPTVTYGSSINSSLFVSSSTFFLGTSGDGVFRTTDSGTTWLFKSSGLTGGNYNEIEVANTTNKIIVVKNGKGYWSSLDGGTTWSINNLADYANHSIKLSDGTIILYGSRVFRSTDNGATFTDNGIYYGDSKIVEAANGDLYGFRYSKISKSTDKGVTWTDLVITGLPATYSFQSAAVDASTNFIFQLYDQTASLYKLFKMVGTTATQLTSPYQYNLNNIFFQNNKFYASQYSSYYYTTDLGTTWTTVGFSGNVVFPIKNASYSGVAVSRNGSLYISQDDGGSWNNTTLPASNPNAYITDISADASGNYYASAQGSAVLKFTSQLLVDPTTLPPYINFNWQPLNGPYGGVISKIQTSPDGNTLFAVVGNGGSNGRLWKYSSGSWSLINPVAVNGGIFDVEVDVSGNVYALPFLNPQKVYKSVNNGATWVALTSTGLPATSSSIVRIKVLSDGSIIAFGVDASLGRIYKSSDGGASFTLKFTSANNVTYGAGNTRIPAASPTAGVVAVMGAIGEGMIVSTDYGTTWTAKSTSSIADPVKGFVGSYMYDKDGNLIANSIIDTSVAFDARVSKSTDNGTTWTLLPTPTISVPGGGNYSKRIVVLSTGEYLMCVQTRFDCYRSTDGGATWNNIGNVGDVFINAVTNGTSSYIMGSSNAGILKTTDGGLTFSSFSNGIPHPNSVEITLLNNKDMVVGATRPYYSSDFGQTFTLANLEPASKYLQVGDSLIGYGGNRRMLKSKDGGKTWAEFGADILYYSFLTKDATGSGFYGSDGSSLKYSTDLINWTNIVLSGLPTSYGISSMVIDSGGVIYAVVTDFNSGLNDVYKIVFGSATKISSVIGTTDPANIIYLNSKIYLYDTRGAIYKSTDGETWTQGSAPSGNSLVVANGYLFIPSSNSVLWLSRNDGSTWQSVGDTPPSSGLIPNFRNVVINEYDGYAYATLSNSVAKKSGNMVIPNDNTKPVATAYSPLNNATNVGLKPTLIITFDEVTNAVAGKLVRVFDLANPAVPIETMDMSTATRNGKSWSIPTTVALSFNKTYFVQMDAGAVADIFVNTYNGISSNATWRFTTKIAPTISSLAPTNAATNVATTSTFKITFSEPVTGVAGKNVVLYASSAPSTAVATLSASTGVSSGNNLTYTFAAGTLQYNTQYFIKADASAFTTADGGVFSVLTLNTDWTFTTALPPDTQAPSIVHSPTPIAQGSGTGNLSATVTDNVGADTVKIYYRSITTNTAFTSIKLSGSNNVYSIAIPEATYGKMGLEYYFTARDAAGNATRSPVTGNHYSYISYASSASPPIISSTQLGIGGQVGNWKIITVPHQLTNAGVSTVFSVLGSNDFSKWRLITYKDQTSWSQYPDDFTAFVQGQGYFVNIKSLPTNSTSGIVIASATTPANNKATPFSFTLKPGWNQIGNPYTFPMEWTEVLTANSNPSGIATTLKTFNGNYVDVGNSGKLEVFEGAFVLNSGTSSKTVTVPIVGKYAGGRISAPSPAATINYDLANDQWTAPITLKIGNVENTFGGVGMNPKAAVGVDEFDDFNPPRWVEYAEMSFAHPEHFLKTSTRDVVTTTAEYNWTFTVNTNLSGLAELKWDNTRFGFNSKELVLLDVNKETLIDMRELNSYSFDPKKSSSFKIYYGDDIKSKIKPMSISLGDAYPNPINNGKVTIPFTVPDGQAHYNVTLEVYDIMGQKMSTLVSQSLASGFYTSQWEPGQETNSGLYIYRMSAISNETSSVLTKKIIVTH